MNGFQRTALAVIAILICAGCNFPGDIVPLDAAQAPAAPVDSNAPTRVSPTETSVPATDMSRPPLPDERAPEVIMILEPGPGSQVTSPLRVRGMADATFEQNLVARLVDSNGGVLLEEPMMIRSPLGERGPFETEIAYAFSGEINALLQVYETSARDGGIAHLATVGLTLMTTGSEQITTRTPYLEQIDIDQPEDGQRISGGIVHVEGIGVASFEGTLVIELYDADGVQLGAQPIIVQAPVMGEPGFFEADVAYSTDQSGPARVVVRDPIPVSNGVNHISSVDIQLLP